MRYLHNINFVINIYSRALLSAVTDEIKANKLADTNIINDLLGFSSESQVRKIKFIFYKIKYL